MARETSRTQQAYGYGVCLIGIVVGLIALHGTIDAIFDRLRPSENPGFVMYGADQSAESFEEYKIRLQTRGPRDTVRLAEPDSVLRRAYESHRRSRYENARWNADKSLVTNMLLLLACIILFATHWRWLRTLQSGTHDGPGTPGST